MQSDNEWIPITGKLPSGAISGLLAGEMVEYSALVMVNLHGRIQRRADINIWRRAQRVPVFIEHTPVAGYLPASAAGLYGDDSPNGQQFQNAEVSDYQTIRAPEFLASRKGVRLKSVLGVVRCKGRLTNK